MASTETTAAIIRRLKWNGIIYKNVLPRTKYIILYKKKVAYYTHGVGYVFFVLPLFFFPYRSVYCGFRSLWFYFKMFFLFIFFCFLYSASIGISPYYTVWLAAAIYCTSVILSAFAANALTAGHTPHRCRLYIIGGNGLLSRNLSLSISLILLHII